MTRRAVLLAAAVLALPLLSGCLAAIDDYEGFDPDLYYKNPVVAEGEYVFSAAGSQVLQVGTLLPGEPEVVRLVSTLPAHNVPSGVDGTVTQAQAIIPMAIWRPENYTVPVPIIVDAGPYFEQDPGCGPEGTGGCGLTDAQQKTNWLLANYLPYGYAIVQLAVRGTGTAGGCMDLLGPAEQHDLDQALTWLGEQEWSNGNIAMIGASYDGSTPWSAAATGNPHLKAIVPTASLPDIFDLMFHNGSAESRGAGMHSQTYWGYGFSDGFLQQPPPPALPPPIPPQEPPALPVPWPIPVIGTANGRTTEQDLQNVCPEVAEGAAMGQYSVLMGDRLAEADSYWAERDHRQAVLDNYKGAVFLLHGLQDWNVDPHSVVPYNQRLRDAGIDVTEWYGQWGHAFPDSNCAKAVPEWAVLPCRLDFAEVMLHWFDRHLKGDMTAPQTWPVQVQDSVGFWRMADSFPPADPDWLELRLSSDGRLAPEVGAEVGVQLDPPQNGGPSQVIELKSEPVPEDLRISGLPQLKLPFAAGGPGGEVAFWLYDEDEEGHVRAIGVCPPNACDQTWAAVPDMPLVGHGSMNLRYYAGGEQEQVLVRGERYKAQMEFEPMEALIPKGHRLTLWLFQFAYPEHQSTQTASPVTVFLGPDTVLRLPTLAEDPTTLFPVPGAHFPTRDNMSLMYVPKPVFTPTSPVGLPAVTVPPVAEARVPGEATVPLPPMPARAGGL